MNTQGATSPFQSMWKYPPSRPAEMQPADRAPPFQKSMKKSPRFFMRSS